MSAIDLHAHVVPPSLRDALRARPVRPLIDAQDRLAMPVGMLQLDAGFWDIETRLALMNAQDIEMQVLSLPCLFGIDTLPAEDAIPLTAAFNEGAAGICAARPDRFRWLASLPLSDPGTARATLAQALDDPLCLGAILPGDCFASIAEAAEMAAYLALIESRGGGLAFIHPGRRPGVVPKADPYPDLAFARRQVDIQTSIAETAITLLYSDMLDACPSVQVQLANLAGTLPMVMERIDQTIATQAALGRTEVRRGRVLADTASLGPHAITLAASVLGPDSLVFGTDCPIFDTAAARAAIANSGLDDAGRAALLSGTARRVIAAASRHNSMETTQ